MKQTLRRLITTAVACLAMALLIAAPDAAQAAGADIGATTTRSASTPAGAGRQGTFQVAHCCHAHPLPPYDRYCCHAGAYVAPVYGGYAGSVRRSSRRVSRRTSRRVSRRR